MYKQYLENVEDLPAFVGCQWFEYYDEPLTGRAGDGENYNIGFVSVTDTPYHEMVESAKAVSAEVSNAGAESRNDDRIGNSDRPLYALYFLACPLKFTGRQDKLPAGVELRRSVPSGPERN